MFNPVISIDLLPITAIPIARERRAASPTCQFANL
jgi:hypothetical protein